MQDMIEALTDIAREAGEAILEVYQGEDFGVEQKSDDSPLTKADLAAHKIISDALAIKYPKIPFFSEESEILPFEERKTWQRYFLVDPLDGTKEFINRNGEFTVNIALIENGRSLVGIVYVPVINRMYAGYSPTEQSERFAWVEEKGERRDISTRSMSRFPDAGEGSDEAAVEPVTVVASRRHGSDEMEVCMGNLNKAFPALETRNMGSSLKLCLIAEGQADLYPRLAPTCEWDTAAAHAVVEAAGGLVVDADFVPLRYNQKDELLNPYFHVIGDPAFDWQGVIKPA